MSFGVLLHSSYEVLKLATHIYEMQLDLKKAAEKNRPELAVEYIIANDFGKIKGYHSAGGRLPDLHFWDESGEYLTKFKNDGRKKCKEGGVYCRTKLLMKEFPTYTLFSANKDSICIAWTSLGLEKSNLPKLAGFHPGNWAYMCDVAGYNSTRQVGSWYYANQVTPGVPNAADNYCLWLDVYGRNFTTGFQIHWPEMNPPERALDDFGYYCKNQAVFNFRSEKKPHEIVLTDNAHPHKPLNTSMSVHPTISNFVNNTENGHHKRLEPEIPKVKHVVKSHRPEHTASKLCNRTLNAAGPSFVSYTEQQFCYMPTKTLYPFCGVDKKGICWDDKINRVVANGTIVKRTSANDSTGHGEIPDLSDIEGATIWGRAETEIHAPFNILISVFVAVAMVFVVLFYLVKSQRRGLKGESGDEVSAEKALLIEANEPTVM